jgi:hypothetical protein
MNTFRFLEASTLFIPNKLTTEGIREYRNFDKVHVMKKKQKIKKKNCVKNSNLFFCHVFTMDIYNRL